MYSVFYTPAASRQLRRLSPEVVSDVRDAIQGLANDPRTVHTEKLEGYPNAYRLRSSRYRVVYTIDDRIRRVVIYRIAHRREAYR